jgi:hypothetical protein
LTRSAARGPMAPSSITGSARRPTASWSPPASIWSIRAGNIPMAPPTSPAPSGSAPARRMK